jgi:hypothetical protein
MLLACLGLLVGLLLPSAGAFAADDPGTGRAGPLAALPSKPGSTIDKINAMGDNSWLNLGNPAPDPKWGSARGCSWGGRSMVLAPELRGAFHTGEGVHAGVKPDGFGQDDYWFYDINQHRWICLYPGTDTKNFNQMVKDGLLKVDGNGTVVDKQGQPIPGHIMIHAWGLLAYDTDQKKFRSLQNYAGFGEYYMPGGKAVSEGIALLKAQGLNKRGPIFAPWAYNTLTGKFERELAVNAGPPLGTFFGQFFYVPSLKQFLTIYGGVNAFDPATNTWSRVPTKGVPVGGSEQGACYDSRRDRFYLGDIISSFASYDVKTQTGEKITSSFLYPFNFTMNNGSLDYDSVNDVVIGFDFWRQKKLYVFDPTANAWVGEIPFDSVFTKTARVTNRAFFDPELGVFFIFTASDSGLGEIWVYKFKGKSSTAPAPAITAQPASQTVPAGQTVTFSVVATGTGLTYQWQKNGADIAGATGASYRTPAVTQADSGTVYKVVVSSAAWSLASAPAILMIAAAGDTVWVEDTIPIGAAPSSRNNGDGFAWEWVSAAPVPYSGSLAHPSTGADRHSFINATQPLLVGAGDKLFTCVYLDPTDPPSEVMLQWYDSARSWEHRAYWGANSIAAGTDGTVSRKSMGALPPTGQWVRLEVPASAVGLEGKTLTGMAFTLHGGKATWDYAGKSAGTATPAAP